MFYPKDSEARDNFTRVMMTRQPCGIVSGLAIDLLHYWTYEDCRDVVNTHFKGWVYVRADLYAYTPKEKQWIIIPGPVLPKGINE